MKAKKRNSASLFGPSTVRTEPEMMLIKPSPIQVFCRYAGPSQAECPGPQVVGEAGSLKDVPVEVGYPFVDVVDDVYLCRCAEQVEHEAEGQQDSQASGRSRLVRRGLRTRLREEGCDDHEDDGDRVRSDRSHGDGEPRHPARTRAKFFHNERSRSLNRSVRRATSREYTSTSRRATSPSTGAPLAGGAHPTGELGRDECLVEPEEAIGPRELSAGIARTGLILQDEHVL